MGRYGQSWRQDHVADWSEAPAYHRGCGATVTVRSYPATWGYDGGSPPETIAERGECGEIGCDEVTDIPQDPCEEEKGESDDGDQDGRTDQSTHAE